MARRSVSLIASTRKLLRNIFGLVTSPVKTTRKVVRAGPSAVKGTVKMGTSAVKTGAKLGTSAVKETIKLGTSAVKGTVRAAMHPVRSVKNAGKLARKTTRRLVKF